MGAIRHLGAASDRRVDDGESAVAVQLVERGDETTRTVAFVT